MGNLTYLEENDNFDYSDSNIKDIVNIIEARSDDNDSKSYSISAYKYIRDQWPYNPKRLSLHEDDWKASRICQIPTGNCLDKAVLLIAVLRAKNIPARLGLAKVKNHIAVENIMEKFGNDVLVPHGYVEIYLSGKWVKATPAFNHGLCEKLNVAPLEFNGVDDSLFQAYDSSGDIKFMEYIEDYGTFDNVPLAFMLKLLRETYPKIRNYNVDLGTRLNFD